MSFKTDFKDANIEFNKFKEIICKHIKGSIIDIESQDNELAKMFDKYSGIDAIQLYNNKIRGIAIRVQWGVNYQTFTIRFSRATGTKTEYEKRCEAIYGDNGFWYPYLTIQVYIDNRENSINLLGFAIVKTKDLYDYIQENLDTLNIKEAPDGNKFICIKFSELKNADKKIIIQSNET